MAKKEEPLPIGTSRAVGSNGEVQFDGQFVTIKHRWNAPGGRGESRYPISAITGAEFKPGFVTCIFTLVVSGGVQRGDAKANRKNDPLSVQGNSQHREGFQTMRDRILQAVAERDLRGAVAYPSAAPGAPAGAPGLAAQIQQLAALRDQGVLSEQEFAAGKARLLGQPGPQDQAPQAW